LETASLGRCACRRSTALPGDGAATILTQSIRATTPRGPFRLALGLLRQLQRLIASDLGRLKDLVEAEIPHS